MYIFSEMIWDARARCAKVVWMAGQVLVILALATYKENVSHTKINGIIAI